MTDQAQDPTQDPQTQQSGSIQDDQSTDPTTGTGTTSNSGDTDFDNLQQELTQTQQKLSEMTVISQRALADLQNYKRRNEEEKAGFITFANAALFTELLPAIESIHRTLAHEQKDREWITGAEQTMKLVLATCEKHGLKAMEVKPGDRFDHNLHEALLTGPGKKDTILELLENGYMLGDRVLKQARVKVGV